MKILICTDGQPYAEETLRFGGRFAHELDADVTALYVRPRGPEGDLTSLIGRRRKAVPWDLEVPGVEVLKRAWEILTHSGLTGPASETERKEHRAFRKSAEGGIEIHRVGHRIQRVRLKLREGDTASEILEEAEAGEYDLILTGSRGHKGSARYFVGSTALRIAEFAICSVMITKNIRQNQNFLICTDGSRLAEKAELFSAKLAQALKGKVTVLSIAAGESDRKNANEQVRRAEMILTQTGLQVKVKVRVGRPSEEIISEARDHDVVVMGASGSSAVKRFFLGSVPLKVIEYGSVPVLLVREKASFRPAFRETRLEAG